MWDDCWRRVVDGRVVEEGFHVGVEEGLDGGVVEGRVDEDGADVGFYYIWEDCDCVLAPSLAKFKGEAYL